MKTGVLLIQLGTPDSPKLSDVRRYLSEFLNDPRVIDVPWLPRKILVNGIIVPFRAPKSAKVYKELWEHGQGKSPLKVHTEKVVELVQNRFKNDVVKVEMAMRYQNPSMEKVLEKMRLANYDQLIINDGDLPEEPGSDLEQESFDEAYDGASDSSTLFQRSFSAGHVRIAKNAHRCHFQVLPRH